jgi:hypothetical protein
MAEKERLAAAYGATCPKQKTPSLQFLVGGVVYGFSKAIKINYTVMWPLE